MWLVVVEVPSAAPAMAAVEIHHERALEARQRAVGLHHTGGAGDADQRAGVVEHDNEEERQHDGQHGRIEQGGNVHLEEHRRDRRRQRGDAGKCAETEGEAGDVSEQVRRKEVCRAVRRQAVYRTGLSRSLPYCFGVVPEKKSRGIPTGVAAGAAGVCRVLADAATRLGPSTFRFTQ